MTEILKKKVSRAEVNLLYTKLFLFKTAMVVIGLIYPEKNDPKDNS